jgi:type II secretory pathway predicted ATPase ExeA
MAYAAKRNMFAVVTSDVGMGKSTLARKFVGQLDPDRYTSLYVSDSKLTPRWFYGGLLDQLGVESRFYRGDSKRLLHRHLSMIREVHRKKVCVIVDEAHLLDRETLEEVRFVLNTDMDSANPMSLVLLGQNELWDKLRMNLYAAIRQRIDIKSKLSPLDRTEVEKYVQSHLKYAGVGSEIFTESALDEIYKYSGGAPRAINKAATHCLLNAAQRNKKMIEGGMAKSVIESELP